MPYRDDSPKGKRYYMVVNEGVRSEIKKAAGDKVEFDMVRDDAPRESEIPAELRAALDADPATFAIWDGLARSHRNEYAEWVAEAKRPETRERRAAQAVERMRGPGT
jgi:uncharacterized protein YdeI (YjbR/CyaY-like superfamily)